MSRPAATALKSIARSPAARVVERIESDAKDPRWAKIFLKGSARSVARLPRESLTELRIRDDMKWTTTVAKRVRQFVTSREAREYSMGLLARASQNATTIARRLERRGFEPAVIVATVAQLVADRWIDDDAHAAVRAESIGRTRPGASAKFIAKALHWEGVDENRAQREGQRIGGSAQSQRQALVVARKAIHERGRKNPMAIANALLRRGIDGAIIEDALRQEGFSFDE